MELEDIYPILLWLTLFVATLVVIVFAFTNVDSAFSLPVLMIFGVIDLFVVLTIAGKTFSKTNLSCRDEALGLPSGSVRALIALSLIIIFAIMAIFMYNQLTPAVTSLHLTANQTVVFANGTSFTNPNGDAFVIRDPSQAQRDFSAQTLTTVSTLVVALAGFYFGTKAVDSARGKETPESQLSIKPEGAVKIKSDDVLPITVESNPENAKVNTTLKNEKDPDSLKQSEKNSKVYLYKPSSGTKLAIIEFSWANDPKVTRSLIVEIE